MEISNATYARLVEMVSKFIKQKNTELEAKFKKNLTLDNFRAVVQYFKSVGFKEEVHEETLDIFTLDDRHARVSLTGRQAIAHYCKFNQITEQSKERVVIITKRSEAKPVYVDGIGCKIDLRSETELKKDDVVSGLSSTQKAFRLKKRFSYTDPSNVVRIDLTIVKSSPSNEHEFVGYSTFAECAGKISNDTFEIEIEIIKREKKVDDIITKLIQHIAEVHLVMENEDFVVSQEDKQKALKGYLRLCFGKDYFDPKKPKLYFAGPQPITLEQRNVIEDDLGVTTIRKNYTVTEKADGERMLLYVDDSGKCFFVDNRLHFRYTGVHLSTITNTVLDGEYIIKSSTNKPIKKYGIFDIYRDNDKDTAILPLVARKKESAEKTRLSLMDIFAQKALMKFKSVGIDLFVKDFRFQEASIFDDCKAILDKGYEYNIDGLIFTPKHLPVGASFEEDRPNLTGTWNKVFKWKPSKDNSIDFLVRSKSSNFTVYNGASYKVLDMYVGFNPFAWKAVSPRDFLEGKVNRVNSYVAEKFIPGDINDDTFAQCYIEVANETDKLLCNDQEITDNCIVEFKYDDNEPIYPLKWKPIRIRLDKTELLRSPAGLPGTANDYGTAMNIWRSIRFPVAEDVIRGKEAILAKDIVEDDLYYYRNSSRENFASRPMLDFHNYWIKNHTILAPFKGKHSSLFDVSCGKGGDLPKWIDNDFTKVLGVDISKDNIENPVDGIYARMLDNKGKKYDPAKHSYVFVCLDSSKRFEKDYFDTLSSSDSDVCQNIWGMKKVDSMAKYYNIANQQFAIVSCQFSIHYFYESEAKLDNLIWNIDRHMKKGGYFVGTCLDGSKVKQQLKSLKKGQSISGSKLSKTLWNITKLYAGNKDIKFGDQIEVFMESIGRKSKEYLVNFDVLVEKLAAKNIVLVTNEGFDVCYAKFTSGDLSNEVPYFVNSIMNMSDEDKQYSFMNMWFMFQKGEDTTTTQATTLPKKKILIKKDKI